MNRKQLKKEIDSKRTNLEKYRNYIKPKEYENISVLEAEKYQKEVELENCFWFQIWAKSDIECKISKLRMRIDELKLLEKREWEVEELVQQLHDIPGRVWGEYPAILDDKIVEQCRNKFKTLPFPLSKQVPFINIIVIGETGSGKSSFIRTFVTALTDNSYIKDVYRTAPGQSREKSTTQEIHLEPMYMGENGPQIPCRFYDMPGIDKENTIKTEDLEKILDGKITSGIEKQRTSDESPADAIHCILYFIKSSTNLEKKPRSLNTMIELKKKRTKEEGVRQFVIVTFIDELGVPNDDMKNAYQYQCVRDYCEEVSEAFGLDLLYVIPVSNYFEEVSPNDAKNAMSLFNLWRVFNSGKEYIERRWIKKETILISKDWTFNKE